MMPQPDPQTVLTILFTLALAVWASLVVWSWVGARLLSGRKVVPFERRRPVPWGGLEVAVIFGVFLFAPLMVIVAAARPLGIDLGRAGPEKAKPAEDARDVEPAPDAEQPDAEGPPREATHPLQQLLSETHNAWYVLLGAAMAVFMAPVVEELLFRVVLQGWLEKVELRYRRRRWWPTLLRVLPGLGPVLFTSLLFAAMHFRASAPRMTVDLVVFFLVCQAVANAVTLAAAAAILRLGSGATLADVGVVGRKLRGDVLLGLLACVAVTGPVYLVQIGANLLVPKSISADPIPLVFLALALGTLYYRTHRAVPSIVLHMAFNAAGLVMLALAGGV